jgi:hypothetical protein
VSDQESGPCLHQQFLARAVLVRRRPIESVLGVPPLVRRAVEGYEQDNSNVHSVSLRGSAAPVATMAALGGIQLQHGVIGFHQDIVVPCGLRQGSADSVCLHRR